LNYINELSEIERLPMGVALMVLTTIAENRAFETARDLLDRVQQAEFPTARRRDIMEMITTILVYKFTSLTKQEIEQMLGTSLRESRFYRDAKEEGREEGRSQERRSLILLQLNQKLGTLSEELVSQLSTLSPERLEALAIALLNFTSLSDLTTWLEQNR
jgi:predicted transposase YdaD